jgi:isoleucyl-tRNA synthetase
MINKEILNNVSAHQRQLDIETAKFAASVGLTLDDYIATMEELHQERLKEEHQFMSKNINEMARVYSTDPDEYRVPGIARKIQAFGYNKP